MSLASLPWLMLFPAMILLLVGRAGPVVWAMLAAGYGLAFVAGQLETQALMAIVALGLAGVAIRPQGSIGLKFAGHLAFVLLALALRAHVMPGFNNALLFDAQVSTGAPIQRVYLNLDKLLVGLWLVAAWPRIFWSTVPTTALRVGVIVGLASALTCIGVSWVVGMVAWDPKSPPGAAIWTVNMVLLVCFCEEVVFRGYIQSGLSHAFRRYAHGPNAALLASSAMFGIAHLGNGGAFALLSVVAALGYGIAYRKGGLLAAVAAHATLNLLHFFLFTYPALDVDRHALDAAP